MSSVNESTELPRKQISKKTVAILLAILVLCVIVLIVISTLYIIGSDVGYAYAIMIDAGSTSSKLGIFRWRDWPFRTNAWVEELDDVDQRPGISDFGKYPRNASAQLLPLINKMLTDFVPKSRWASTSLFLGATAGMRLLNLQNPIQADAVMEEIRQSLPTSAAHVGNVFSDIRIISGSNEGRFAWTSANYLSKKLGDSKGMLPSPPDDMTGALDLGGASTQIAFIPQVAKGEHTYPISLFQKNYHLYSYSFLCYGKEANSMRYIASLVSAMKNQSSNTVESPCHLLNYRQSFPKATVFSKPCVTSELAVEIYGSEIPMKPGIPEVINIVGSGNQKECRRHVNALFSKTTCTQRTCSFNNVYQPPVRGKYYAFAGFYFPIAFYKFPTGGRNLQRSQVAKAVNEYCSKNWDEVLPTLEETEKLFAHGYCFDGVYIDALLDGYGFKTDHSWKNIEFVQKVDGATASWRLGYVVEATGHIQSAEPRIMLDKIGFIAGVIVLLLIAFGIIGVLIFMRHKLTT